LGLYIDEKLTWNKHSVYLQSKLRKINYLFYYFANNMNVNHLKHLYKPLYESVLAFGIIHWGASAHLKPLKVLQNKVCRSILSLPIRSSEIMIYEKMNSMCLEKLYTYRMLMFVFKNKNDFQLYNSEIRTRRNGEVVATHTGWRKDHSRRQARFKGHELFNDLPGSIRSECRLSTYKRGLRILIRLTH
jgi:hypothetical protein